MTTRGRVLAGVGAMGVVALAGLFGWRLIGGGAASARPGKAPSSRVIPVVVTAAQTRDVPIELDGLGTFVPLATVTLKSRVDGRLDQVLFKEGQAVKRGEPLALLDPRPFRIQLDQANAIIQADPDVAHMVAFIGGGHGSNTGTVFVELKPKPGRKATAAEIINRLRPKLAKVTGLSLILQAAQDIRVGGRMSRSQYQYTLQDADLAELRAFAPVMLEKLKKLPMLRDVTSDEQSAGMELALHIDRDTAARLGITPKQIDDTLYDAYGQRQVATRFTQLNQYRVVMEVKPELQNDARGFSHLYLRSADGGLVPLDALTTVKPGTLPLSVNHQGQFAATTLSFNLAPGVSLSEATAAIEKVKGEVGLPAGVRGTFMGTAKAYNDSQSSQVVLILTALLAVYVVLGVLYESYVHPLTILSTLPPAGVGALLALLAFGVELSVVGLVAIILLIGIVKKNAIMMVDFALEAQRDLGLSPTEAIVRACRLRLRPILMTTLAALLGGLPLALGSGTGSELRRPLGIAIVGGLLVSQLVTMFTTPVVYLTLDRFTRKRKPAQSGEEAPVRA